MKNFGKNVKIKPKKQQLTEKDLFIDIITAFDDCYNRSIDLIEKFNVDLSEYEEYYYLIIENLIALKYEGWKAEVILWWVYDRFDDEGKLKPIAYTIEEENSENEIIISTPEQLWDFLKQIENLEKND